MSKPLPILSHMPWFIKKMIVESTDGVAKYSLRQCSKEYKLLVNNSATRIQILRLDWMCDREYVEVSLMPEWTPEEESEILRESDIWRQVEKRLGEDHWRVLKFHARENGFLVENIEENWERAVENGNFIEAAVAQFVKILKNPKVFIYKLSVTFQHGYRKVGMYKRHKSLLLETLKGHLSKLGHQLAVETFVMSSNHKTDDILHVLPYLKPGTLKSVQHCAHSAERNERQRILHCIDLNPITNMEQWKRLKCLELPSYVLRLDREKTSHIPEMCYFSETFDVEELEQTLSDFLREKGWETRIICFRLIRFSNILQYLSQFGTSDGDCFTIKHEGFECRVLIGRISSVKRYGTIYIYKSPR